MQSHRAPSGAVAPSLIRYYLYPKYAYTAQLNKNARLKGSLHQQMVKLAGQLDNPNSNGTAVISMNCRSQRIWLGGISRYETLIIIPGSEKECRRCLDVALDGTLDSENIIKTLLPYSVKFTGLDVGRYEGVQL
jgi:hypothetical protein